jgi:hypothetical protein
MMAIARAINFKAKSIPTTSTVPMVIIFTVFTPEFYN